MVKVTDLPVNVRGRFINREQLEAIEERLKIVPSGNYYYQLYGTVYLQRGESINESVDEKMLTVHRLGCSSFYTLAADDVRLLVEHVKAADEENDRLSELFAEKDGVDDDKPELPTEELSDELYGEEDGVLRIRYDDADLASAISSSVLVEEENHEKGYFSNHYVCLIGGKFFKFDCSQRRGDCYFESHDDRELTPVKMTVQRTVQYTWE